MTTTIGKTDAAQHPDVSEIADLTEGLLAPLRAAEVRAHLGACPACDETRASLEEIRDLLGDLGNLPGSEPMPADVAARIDIALAVESVGDSFPERPADLLPSGSPEREQDDVPDVRIDVSRETSIRSQSASVSADTAPALPSRPNGHARATTGPGRGSRRKRHRTAAVGAVFTVAAIGLGTFLLQPTDDGNSASGRTEKNKISTFSGEKVQDRVSALLSHPASPKTMNTKHTPNAPMDAPVLSVPACVTRSIDEGGKALAAEKGDYRGTSAYLVVLPHPTDDARVSVFVVDASCETAAPPAKGDVLLHTSYPLN